MARSDQPDHQLVTRYEQNPDSADWAIFMGKIIMAQPSPLSALSRGPKSWSRRSGRIRFECKRLGQGKSLAAVMSVRSWRTLPLSALCTANEIAVVIEAGPEVESFVNANGSDWSKSPAAVECVKPAQSTERFWPSGLPPGRSERGTPCDRRQRVA
jgi:hypothetical protein